MEQLTVSHIFMIQRIIQFDDMTVSKDCALDMLPHPQWWHWQIFSPLHADFDLLKDVGTHGKTSTVFLNHSPGKP